MAVIGIWNVSGEQRSAAFKHRHNRMLSVSDGAVFLPGGRIEAAGIIGRGGSLWIKQILQILRPLGHAKYHQLHGLTVSSMEMPFQDQALRGSASY